MINFIATTVIIIPLIVILFKIIKSMGANFQFCDKFKVNRYLDDTILMDYNKYTPNKKDIYIVAIGAVCVRVIIYFISIILMNTYLSEGSNVNITTFLSEWKKWDATNYIRIATLGYDGYFEMTGIGKTYTTLVFFPFYAWIVKFFNFIINNPELSCMIVSSVTYVIGCCYLFAFVSIEYGKDIAIRTVTYTSLFPFAFFFGSMMPESTFFMLICACLYYIKQHKWWIASLIGAFAALTRMQGILMVIPMFIEWLEYRKPIELIKERKKSDLFRYIFREVVWIPIVLVGSVVYLLVNYVVTGEAFMFLKYQKEVWNQEAQWFGKTISQISDRIFDVNYNSVLIVSVWIPELIIFIFSVIMIWYGIGKIHDKYMVFLIVYVIMNYLPTWLLSGGRYMTVAVPMFLILAIFTERHKWSEKWIVSISAGLMCIYLFRFLTWMQVM